MNEAAAALTTARNEIVKIQKEMAERYIKLAAAIDKLHCQMPPDETREFLVNRCGVPGQDIASLARFSRRLGGFEKTLLERRLPLTVIKSLASASTTTVRGVALARIASGARFDATDLKAIRREIRTPRPAQSSKRSMREGAPSKDWPETTPQRRGGARGRSDRAN